MIKVAMIGAGSVVFSKNLTGDILSYPEFRNATFSYMDVDRERHHDEQITFLPQGSGSDVAFHEVRRTLKPPTGLDLAVPPSRPVKGRRRRKRSEKGSRSDRNVLVKWKCLVASHR